MTESAGAKPQERSSPSAKPKRASVMPKHHAAVRRGEGESQDQESGLLQDRPAVRPLDAGALGSQAPAATVSRFAQDLSQVPSSLQLKGEEESDGAAQATSAAQAPAAPASTRGPVQLSESSLPGGQVVQTVRVPFAQVIARTSDGTQGQQEQEQQEEPVSIEEVAKTPEETEALDSIAATLNYRSSIEQGGATPEGFGVCRTSASLRGITITPGSGSYTVRGRFELEIRWQVRSGVGPRNQVNIASADDPALRACNYQRAVYDLTPNMGDLGGRPPRSKFWCQDLTGIHERYHATDRQTFGEDGAETAQNWLSAQSADSSGQIERTLLRQALDEGWDTVNTLMAAPPGKEPRAYGDGAPLYQARATAIEAKGLAGDYGQVTADVSVLPKGGEPYEIVSGDTLVAIAERTYGDARYWRDIYRANRDRVHDGGNLIYPGTVLDLPAINIDQRVMVSFSTGGVGYITDEATVPGGGSHQFTASPADVFTRVHNCDGDIVVEVVDPELNTLLSTAWHLPGSATGSRGNIRLSVGIST